MESTAKKILIAYSTNAGSTAEVAAWMGEAIEDAGGEAEIRDLREVKDLSPYCGAVIGGPMILGWHKRAIRFVKRHDDVLSRIPTAFFCTALHVTVPDSRENPPGIIIDKSVIKTPVRSGALNFKEGRTTIDFYLKPLRKQIEKIHPLSIAFLGGKLDYRNLKFPQAAFVMLVIGAKPGEFRNRDLIKTWAAELTPRLKAKKE